MDLRYPTEFEENLRFRARLLNDARGNRDLQAALKELSRRERLFFFNTFLWTYDPRKAMKKLPFLTYAYQDDIIMWDATRPHVQREDGGIGVDSLVEKSRDMGVTWMFVGNDLYDWIFSEERLEFLWGSRKEQYVDEIGNMDSIFEKFRFAIDNLPKWMLPAGYRKKEHDNYMRLKNPVTDSVIVGEATNNDFGRGGRKYRIRLDEFAFWDCAENAWKSAASSTNCRTALSTPSEKPVNKFAKLAQGTEEKIDMRTLHWTLHPEKAIGTYYIDNGKQIPLPSPEQAFRAWEQRRGEKAPGTMIGGVVRSPWYDAEAKRRNEQELAQEIDIDYASAGNMFFSSRALSLQTPWELYKRKAPTDPIPWGKYVEGKLILEKNTKVKFIERPNGTVRLYELPQEGSQYVISSDTAEGLPWGDYNAAYVRDKWTRNTVASIHSQEAPEDFAYKCWLLERYYDNALNAPENNNHGYTTALELENLGSNLYYTRSNRKGSQSVIKRGFSTTSVTRPYILDRMEAEVRNHVELRDPELIQEGRTFIRSKRGKPEAMEGFNDDRIIAWAIGGYVIEKYPYKAPKKKKQSTSRRAKVLLKQKNAGFSFSGAGKGS